ncbi:hypothetical protein [Ehrlichia ruminantium]|uniref:hypothetical protein n=1 Tax=Ehrlichia ruminantium TaxID=779 RepID=UPI00079FFEEC|nr:hypothetical protein [Ehrlichia ruminantium]KYW96721.1 hypothetical protein AUR40_01175 [Ehrlichia ruminantium]UOD99010.1 hypothetical protein IMW63_01290 [Ehrlichia ruminantium]
MNNNLLTYILISTIAIIAILFTVAVFYIRLYYNNKYDIAPFVKKISTLSFDKLGQKFTLANSTIKEISSAYKNVEICIGKTIITDQDIIKEYNDNNSEGNNELIKKHTQYLEGNTTGKNKTTYHNTQERIKLGVALEKIFIRHTSNVPDISLIHHMLSYIYAPDYLHSLYNMLDDTIEKKSDYCTAHSTTPIKIQIKNLPDTMPNKFLINIALEKTLTSKKNPIFSIPLNANIRFLISLPHNDNTTLYYSSGVIDTYTSQPIHTTITTTKETSSNISKYSTIEAKYILPNFVIQHNASESHIQQLYDTQQRIR